MGRNLRISLEIMKSAANPRGGLCGPIFLKWNIQSTENLCGALSVNFPEKHEEDSEFVWGAIYGFRWKSRRAQRICVGKRTDRAQEIRMELDL